RAWPRGEYLIAEVDVNGNPVVGRAMRYRVRRRCLLMGLVVAASLAGCFAPGGRSALPPGYVRLSQGTIVAVYRSKIICAVEHQTTNVSSPVVGIRCGPGSSSGPTPGSYWAALRLPNNVVVARFPASGPATTVFSRGPKQTGAYVTAGGQVMQLPAPKQ